MTALPDYRPRVPADPGRVGVIGAGAIARTAHLPAYSEWGIPVTAVASRTPASADLLADEFGIPHVHGSVDELLADDAVDVVDIATGPEGRVEVIAAAVRAGKHVLAQKPVVADETDLHRLQEVLADARSRGVCVAVNQNARWAPSWRLATLLIREGVIGDVVGVTHLHDKPLPPLAGTPFDALPHMLITDYLVHWIDITRCWLEGSRVTGVTAHDSRVPGQPANARNPWHADILVSLDSGASASIRVVGDVRGEARGCPFWIHGTAGTLRGSVLQGTDRLELDTGEGIRSLPLTGAWFNDGFAGAMGELLTAVDEGRQPENAAEHVVATVRLGLAAERSVTTGSPVAPVELHLDPPASTAKGNA